MKARALKWALALAASAVVHGGAAALLVPKHTTAKIAGGEPTEVAVLGNAFADQIAAGKVADTIEPVSNTPAELKSVEAEEAELTKVEDAAEVPVEQRAEVDSVEPAEIAPAQPAKAAETVQAENAPEAEIALTPIAEAKSSPAGEPETAKPVIQDEAVKPAKPDNELTALADVPTPTPRPDYTPPKRTEKREAKAQKQPTRRAAGSGGQSEADARRGANSGRDTGAAAQQGRDVARANSAGNAAVSNYPGKIVRKLRRNLRYPAAAKRGRLEGQVHVSFTISRDGGVGSVRVVRSSGSPLLDEAAIATVRRAAPFPPIPQAARRSSWPFTVPLAFVR